MPKERRGEKEEREEREEREEWEEWEEGLIWPPLDFMEMCGFGIVVIWWFRWRVDSVLSSS